MRVFVELLAEVDGVNHDVGNLELSELLGLLGRREIDLIAALNRLEDAHAGRVARFEGLEVLVLAAEVGGLRLRD